MMASTNRFVVFQFRALKNLSAELFGDSETGRTFLSDMYEFIDLVLFLQVGLFILHAFVLVYHANRCEQRWIRMNFFSIHEPEVKRSLANINDDNHKNRRAVKSARSILVPDMILWLVYRKALEFRQQGSSLLFVAQRAEFLRMRSPLPPFEPNPNIEMPSDFPYGRYLARNLAVLLTELTEFPPGLWIFFCILAVPIMAICTWVHQEHPPYLGFTWGCLGFLAATFVGTLRCVLHWHRTMLCDPRLLPAIFTGVIPSPNEIEDDDSAGMPGWSYFPPRMQMRYLRGMAPNAQHELFLFGVHGKESYTCALQAILVFNCSYMAVFVTLIVPQMKAMCGGTAIAVSTVLILTPLACVHML